ncbi:oxidase [Lithospermum erythrorhizon]|uniref:Oxidase n=1 Tax=Lithospermum erythrorhizon TaxID=34254 RepID=A0AAV3R5A4_LITER
MLPYLSIPEAELSLGRNLTIVETLWFNYSATKSDYFLYCHNTIFLFMFYTMVPLPWVVMELKRSKKTEQYKIQPKVKRSLSDMFNCYKKVIMVLFVAIVPLQLLSYPVIKVGLLHF